MAIMLSVMPTIVAASTVNTTVAIYSTMRPRDSLITFTGDGPIPRPLGLSFYFLLALITLRITFFNSTQGTEIIADSIPVTGIANRSLPGNFEPPQDPSVIQSAATPPLQICFRLWTWVPAGIIVLGFVVSATALPEFGAISTIADSLDIRDAIRPSFMEAIAANSDERDLVEILNGGYDINTSGIVDSICTANSSAGVVHVGISQSTISTSELLAVSSYVLEYMILHNWTLSVATARNLRPTLLTLRAWMLILLTMTSWIPPALSATVGKQSSGISSIPMFGAPREPGVQEFILGEAGGVAGSCIVMHNGASELFISLYQFLRLRGGAPGNLVFNPPASRLQFSLVILTIVLIMSNFFVSPAFAASATTKMEGITSTSYYFLSPQAVLRLVMGFMVLRFVKPNRVSVGLPKADIPKFSQGVNKTKMLLDSMVQPICLHAAENGGEEINHSENRHRSDSDNNDNTNSNSGRKLGRSKRLLSNTSIALFTVLLGYLITPSAALKETATPPTCSAGSGFVFPTTPVLSSIDSSIPYTPTPQTITSSISPWQAVTAFLTIGHPSTCPACYELIRPRTPVLPLMTLGTPVQNPSCTSAPEIKTSFVHSLHEGTLGRETRIPTPFLIFLISTVFFGLSLAARLIAQVYGRVNLDGETDEGGWDIDFDMVEDGVSALARDNYGIEEEQATVKGIATKRIWVRRMLNSDRSHKFSVIGSEESTLLKLLAPSSSTSSSGLGSNSRGKVRTLGVLATVMMIFWGAVAVAAAVTESVHGVGIGLLDYSSSSSFFSASYREEILPASTPTSTSISTSTSSTIPSTLATLIKTTTTATKNSNERTTLMTAAANGPTFFCSLLPSATVTGFDQLRDPPASLAVAIGDGSGGFVEAEKQAVCRIFVR
ncbi:MAG: hypothetical protein M1834_002343 [Cirrosporium novae-zelandiae]|nr:MAG: hypothetical protein M1834_002343 [Cirrosporium novae-zelandiae]